MAILLWLFSYFILIDPFVNAQHFSSSFDSAYSCVKTSQVLHINLGSSDSSPCSLQNATPIQFCQEEAKRQGSTEKSGK